jgi:hypothetical protein
MIVGYCPHSKNVHNLKVELGKFSNSKYVFKIPRFQESFIACKWGVMYITYKTKL